jgi:hypothetical protein
VTIGKKPTADAITSLSSSVVSSTVTGHLDLAKAGSQVVVELNKGVIYLSSPRDINPQILQGLQSTATAFEQSAEKAGVPNTYIFKFKQDRDSELKKSATVLQKVDTWAHWGMGLGKVVDDWAGILKPFGRKGDS